jgi:hypothetical protein
MSVEHYKKEKDYEKPTRKNRGGRLIMHFSAIVKIDYFGAFANAS